MNYLFAALVIGAVVIIAWNMGLEYGARRAMAGELPGIEIVPMAVGPNDKIVLKIQDRLTRQSCDFLSDQMGRVFPEQVGKDNIIVLEGGAELQIVRGE